MSDLINDNPVYGTYDEKWKRREKKYSEERSINYNLWIPLLYDKKLHVVREKYDCGER
jgi:hypothetical protein